MNGQHIGYVRVSTLDQSERRRLEGQVLDRIYSDKASGRDTERPTFAARMVSPPERSDKPLTPSAVLFMAPSLSWRRVLKVIGS